MADESAAGNGATPCITVRDLTMAYGSFVLMRDMTFTVNRGDVFIIMGGSGSGKSTLLRHLIGLNQPAHGSIHYEGQNFTTADPRQRERMLRDVGVLFQGGALWSAMTLSENIGLLLEEYTDLKPAAIRQVAALKLALVGLKGFEDWGRTADKTGEGWIQADRGGRPMQAVFLVGEEREAYLSGGPVEDSRFVGAFAHQLEHAGGYTPEDTMRVAGTLLPDILALDPRRRVSFPYNGRTLIDDAVDVFLSILTNGKVTADKVGPHGDLLDEFPYLGPPDD